jgi:methyl-accepting chemotaxis protein
MPSGNPNSVEEIVADAKRAAKDLASATLRLSRHLIDKAEHAARDPSASAKKAMRRVSEELHEAGKEVERLLRKL